MIICHCEVVSDRAVTASIDNGARTLSSVCNLTGAGQRCGACVFSLKRVLCEHEAVRLPSPMEVEVATG